MKIYSTKKKSSTFAKTKLAVAVAALFGVLVSPSAVYAGAQSSAFMDLTNFVMKGSDGNVLEYGTDIDFLTFVGTADQDATLGAVSASNSGATGPSDTSIDFPVICVGDGCPIINENEFPLVTGAPTDNYATVDQLETGAPIANLPGFPVGARVANGSYTAVAVGTNDASANSNNNLQSSWTFTLNQPGGITFEFDAAAYLEAHLGTGEIFPSFSTASYQLAFSILDVLTGNTVFAWQPGKSIFGGTEELGPFSLESTVSLNGPTLGQDTLTSGGHTVGSESTGQFRATTGALAANTPYQLSARLLTNADLARVEVPDEEGCRLTGGAVSESETLDGEVYYTWVDGTYVDGQSGTNRYQFGGQVGANTALPPKPKGEWQHHQQSGPAGSFSFHGGTASAPAGTEIVDIRCSDPGGCAPSGNPPSPNKQLDFDGIGTFHNLGNGKNAPRWLTDANVTAEGKGNKNFAGTFHWFEVNVDDLGEGPDPKEGDSALCPVNGFGEKGVATLPANCDCPDFYRITIYNGVNASDVTWVDGRIDPTSLDRTNVIYEVRGYTGLGGNGLQLHDLTGFDRK